MSSNIISSWKDKSEIDYFSLFFPLWLAFDAWLKDKYGKPNQRECLEALKNDSSNNKTFQKFKALLQGTNSNDTTFKSYLVQLNQALLSSPKPYEKDMKKYLSFEESLTDNKNKIYENLFKKKTQSNKLKLIEDTYITDEIEKIYKAYIEILYQVRCNLFHGDLSPNKENQKIIQYLYLTLKDLTREI